TPRWRAQARQPEVSARLPFLFEADLDFYAVLDDFAVADLGRRLHDLDRLDIANGLRGGFDGPPSGVTPRVRTAPDHLPDDDDAHELASSCAQDGELGSPAGLPSDAESLDPGIDEAGPWRAGLHAR